MVEEAAGALDGKIVASEPTGTLIGQSAFLCVGEKTLEIILHYTTIFFICMKRKKFFCGGRLREWSVDKILEPRGECRP